MSIEALAGLVQADVPLTSKRRRGGRGLSYTEAEYQAAEFIARLILTTSNYAIKKPVTDDEIHANERNELIVDLLRNRLEQGGSFDSIVQGMRNLYRYYEDIQLSDDETMDDFPKMNGYGDRENRNQSSITVLFRSVLKEYMSKDDIDKMFNMHHEKKAS